MMIDEVPKVVDYVWQHVGHHMGSRQVTEPLVDTKERVFLTRLGRAALMNLV